MTTLTDIFSLEDLESNIAAGYVRRQFHPDDPTLAILNYSEKAQFDREWNPVTKACRGLIYNTETLYVLARPFPKFHNWDEGGQPYPPAGPFIIMDKMDRSLGILYDGPSGMHQIATRGSFASEQAKIGTALFHRTIIVTDCGWVRQPGKTYLWEIIYPENRIVVDYHGETMLILLDVVDNATGLPDLATFDATDWPHKVRRRLETGGFRPQLLEEETLEGDEGIVLMWPRTGYRVKMKRADYVALHSIVTGLDERKVWQALCNHVDINKFCEPLPDEFHDWVKSVAARILVQKNEIMKEAFIAWAEAVSGLEHNYTRKDLALRIAKHPMRAYIFMLEDSKDIGDAVLSTLQPEGNQYVKQISEDVA